MYFVNALEWLRLMCQKVVEHIIQGQKIDRFELRKVFDEALTPLKQMLDSMPRSVFQNPVPDAQNFPESKPKTQKSNNGNKLSSNYVSYCNANLERLERNNICMNLTAL